MSSRAYRNILQYGIMAVLVVAPFAKGAMKIWSIAFVEIVVLLLLFLWLWRVNNGSSEFKRTGLEVPVVLFIMLALGSSATSIYKHASIVAMLKILTICGAFYLFSNNFSSRRSVSITGLIITIGATISLLGLAQYFLGLEHSWWKPEEFLAATYVNHNHFAGYLEIAIPLAIGILVFLKRSSVSTNFKFISIRAGLVTGLIVMVLAFVFSQSRAGWACLTTSLLIMVSMLVRRRILRRWCLFVFVFLIVMTVAYIYAGDDAVATRFRSFEKFASVGFIDGRVQIWQGTLDMIRQRPFIGTGIGTYVWGLQTYRPQAISSIRPHYAHNDYLHVMAEVGVFVLPLILWVLIVLIGSGFRLRRKEREPYTLMDGIRFSGAIGLLSLALHGLVDFNFHITANILTLACVAGIIMKRKTHA